MYAVEAETLEEIQAELGIADPDSTIWKDNLNKN